MRSRDRRRRRHSAFRSRTSSLRGSAASLGFALPAPGAYGVAMAFFPVEKNARLRCEGILERMVREEGLTVLGWRDTPVDGNAIGRVARASQPYIQQIFVGRPEELNEDAFERKLYVVRKRAEAEIAAGDIEYKSFFYIPSLSCRTIVYKGLLLAPQIANFYNELSDPGRGQRAVPGAPALLHQHISQLAAGASLPLHRPQRRDQHAEGQRQLDACAPVGAGVPAVRRRHQEAVSHHSARRQRFGEFRQRRRTALPVGPPPAARHGHADSGSLGRQSAHEPEKTAFYEYHASLMEPWDGPAAIAFTDGRVIGATLDRNGLRPGRYLVTKDDLVIMASESRRAAHSTRRR